jgi:hypothetical protein
MRLRGGRKCEWSDLPAEVACGVGGKKRQGNGEDDLEI